MQVDHEYLGQCLADVGVDARASGAHGLLCGLVCAGEKEIQQRLAHEWFSSLPERDSAIEECQRAIDGLTQDIHVSVNGMDFGFPLLLPDDDSPLQQRAAAVRDWCEGFLYGVGLVELKSEDGLPEQVKEALSDLAEISRMDIDSVVGDEEEEEALTEVIEFIWVAVMLVHDELVEAGSEGTEE
ncbi:MAG: UPF0149 family protein [Gammaproteobacteria bacterium]